MTHPTRRRGIALAVVGALLAFLALGVLAFTTYRRNAGRNLAAVVHRMEAVGVATAAIAEVAHEGRLNQVFADGSNLNRLKEAFANAEYVGGSLQPAPMDVEVPADEVAARKAGDSSLTISPVRVRVVRYLPGRRMNRGTLRFTVEVQKSLVGRTTRVIVAEDYGFRMYDAGDETLAFQLAPAPRRRVTS